MKLFLDSSYLIYLRYAEDDRVSNYVTSLLQRAIVKNVELLTNMIVIDEVAWILLRKYTVSTDETFELLDRLLPLMVVIPLDSADYATMKQIMGKYGLKPSDSLHIASMKKAETTYLVSEDKHFDRVPSVRRVWLNTSDLSIG